VTGLLNLPTAVIEFLIPVTIAITGIENLIVRDRSVALGRRYRPVLAGLFGLVHGAGFANYLKSLFVERIAVPLLGFNVGLEVGQLFVLGLAALVFVLVDRAIAALRPVRWSATPLRLRTIAVSAIVVIVAARWAVERSPW
jgi:hypothetical protein